MIRPHMASSLFSRPGAGAPAAHFGWQPRTTIAANKRHMLHFLRSVTECISQRLGTNTVTTRTRGTCPRGRPCGVPCADPLIRTRFKAATIASASRSTTNRADPGTADIPGAGRDLGPPGSSIFPFSQDCGTRVSRQYLQMAAEGAPSDRIAVAMALQTHCAAHRLDSLNEGVRVAWNSRIRPGSRADRNALSAPFLDVGDSRRSPPDASRFSSVDGTD